MYKAKFVKNGNVKVGGDIWTFNKLAGNTIIGGCKGSCGEHCKGCWNSEDPKHSPCYVRKSYVQYGWDNGSVVRSHIQNTTALRTDLIGSFEDLNTQIKRAKKKPVAIRIHASGEYESAAEIKQWAELATKWPDIPFYVYTKAYEMLDEVLSTSKLPKNFYINISIWYENGISCYNKWKKLDNIRAFVYNDGQYNYKEAGLKINCKCPAYNEKGKLDHNYTCDKCKICYQKKAKVCSCSSH